MKIPFLILLLASLCGGSILHANDYSVIDRIPRKVAAAMKEGHKGWDTGVTPAVKEASEHYNDALLAIIKTLVKTYYPKGYISVEEIDDYLKGLYAVGTFKQVSGNPTGESLGTEAPLDVYSDVSADLEKMIVEMVQAIAADDPKFHFKAWKQRWRKSTSTGNGT